MENGSTWCARIGGAVLMLGVACAAGGGAQAAALGQGLSGARPAASAIQPVYWVRDRFGRRVWVQHHYRPPVHRRHGWVDRHGHWHPYR